MESTIKSRSNFFTGSTEIEYRLVSPISAGRESLAKFAWHLLHTVLPREVRSGGITKNMKGISFNNVLRDGLPFFEVDNENLLYHIDGKAPIINPETEERTDGKEDSFYSVKSDFHVFPDRRNIHYKSNICFEGGVVNFLQQPIFQFDSEIEISDIFLGLEFFEANLFWLIGLAPRITKALLIQVYENDLYIRLKLEQKKTNQVFSGDIAEIIEKLNNLVLEIFNVNIKEDFEKKAAL